MTIRLAAIRKGNLSEGNLLTKISQYTRLNYITIFVDLTTMSLDELSNSIILDLNVNTNKCNYLLRYRMFKLNLLNKDSSVFKCPRQALSEKEKDAKCLSQLQKCVFL